MRIVKHNILVIDDDRAMLDCIRLSLGNVDSYRVTVCDDPRDALNCLEMQEFSAVITDINMPQLSGLDVLKSVNEYDPKIPVILITGNKDPNLMQQAIHLGVFEFLKKPFEMNDLLVTTSQAVQKNQLLIQNDLYQNHLETLVQQRTVELFDAKSKLEKSYLNTIHAMVNAMEANDIYTRGHSERVTAISMGLGRALGLGRDELRDLRIGALLHDLGKIGIISNVLNKEQSLTTSEYDIIKQHPIIGEKIISPIGLPDRVHKIILQHHEWFNGLGYPYGVEADSINLLARIVSVADSFDAMTSKRPYRRNLEYRSAGEEIKRNLSTQFDPELGIMFCNKQSSIIEVLRDSRALKFLLEEQI